MHNQGKSIVEFGEEFLENKTSGHHILFLSIIGEIEGHDVAGERTKTTKYEHLLPLLARAQDDDEIDGVLMLINTVGGDCSCGLAAAEMIASIRKPVASLIIGDSHPVRLNGTVIGAPQTFDYFKLIQDRILDFIASHSRAKKTELEKMMMHKGILAKDLGTILVGRQAVDAGLADQVGGIADALDWVHEAVSRG